MSQVGGNLPNPSQNLESPTFSHAGQSKKNSSGSEPLLREHGSGEAHTVKMLEPNTLANTPVAQIANTATKALSAPPTPKQSTLENHTVTVPLAGSNTQSAKPDQVAQSTFQPASPQIPADEVDDLLASLDVANDTDVDNLIASLDVSNEPANEAAGKTKFAEITLTNDFEILDRNFSNPSNLKSIGFDKNGTIILSKMDTSNIETSQAIFDKSTGEVLYKGIPNQSHLDALNAFTQAHCLQNNLPIPKNPLRIVSEENWHIVVNKFTAATQHFKEDISVKEKQPQHTKHAEQSNQLPEISKVKQRSIEEKTSEKTTKRQSFDNSRKEQIKSMELKQEISNMENLSQEKKEKIQKNKHGKKIENIELKHEERLSEIKIDENKGTENGKAL